jgi:hypothetical protein
VSEYRNPNWDGQDWWPFRAEDLDRQRVLLNGRERGPLDAWPLVALATLAAGAVVVVTRVLGAWR